MENKTITRPKKAFYEFDYVMNGEIELYMDESLPEEFLIEAKLTPEEIERAKYMLIACNWSFNIDAASWFEYYVHLIDKKPKTQKEFDKIQAKIDGTWEDWTEKN